MSAVISGAWPSFWLTVEFLTACAIIMAYPAPAQTRPIRVKLELILAVDVSVSINEEKTRLNREGYVAAINDLQFIGTAPNNSIPRVDRHRSRAGRKLLT